MRANTQWASRQEFHEIAEALKVSTENIAAAMHVDRGYVVFYSQQLPENAEEMSPEEIEAQEVHSVILQRDGEQILRVAREPQIVPDFWKTMMAGGTE